MRPLTEPGLAPRDMRALAFEVLARLTRARHAIEAESSQTSPGRRVRTRGSESRRVKDEQGSGVRPPGSAASTQVDDDPPTPAAAPKALLHVLGKQRLVERADERNDDDYEGPTLPDGMAALEASSLDAQVQTMFQAERHFRRGERALRRNRFEEAVHAFEEAVGARPEEGEFLAWLGYARHAAAPNDRVASDRALEELSQGCRLAPKLDVPHILSARVLRDWGDVVAARNAYERALAANPDCAEALQGLRDLGT